jgi:hypothetical protein
MLSPIAASENTRNGIITEEVKKSLPMTGTPTKAISRMTAMPIRS